MAWLIPLALAAYVQRFAVSWWMTAHGGAAGFDPHAFGLLGDGILLCGFAPPLSVLFWWVVRHRRPWRGIFAPASAPGWTALSVVWLIVIGAPLPGQVWAVVLLPLASAWPAALSAALWFTVCAVLRAWSVGPPRP